MLSARLSARRRGEAECEAHPLQCEARGPGPWSGVPSRDALGRAVSERPMSGVRPCLAWVERDLALTISPSGGNL